MSHSAETILALREEKKELRDREFARSIGISEAELVAAHCSTGSASPLLVDVPLLLEEGPKLGEIMALTRNESAVHERIGRFEKIFPGKQVSMTLGEIDLRIFQDNWKFGFVRQMNVHGRMVNSLQFFDAFGEAVFKLYPEEGTDLAAWDALIALLRQDAPSADIEVKPTPSPASHDSGNLDIEEFRSRWSNMTDVHQLHGILQEMKISRHDAVKYVGDEFANELERNAVELMLDGAIANSVPIMCFVGNHGCIQIFTGKVQNTKTVGEGFNILDDKFHLHLLTSGIDRVWHVRKPTSDGHVSSLEVFDSNGEMIIQFFGERKEGQSERQDWRALLENLPLLQKVAVA